MTQTNLNNDKWFYIQNTFELFLNNLDATKKISFFQPRDFKDIPLKDKRNFIPYFIDNYGIMNFLEKWKKDFIVITGKNITENFVNKNWKHLDEWDLFTPYFLNFGKETFLFLCSFDLSEKELSDLKICLETGFNLMQTKLNKGKN